MQHTFRPDSSNIASAGYDPETRVLEITFGYGGTYRYRDVDPETWQEFQSAPSAGGYHRRHIDGEFDHSASAL